MFYKVTAMTITSHTGGNTHESALAAVALATITIRSPLGGSRDEDVFCYGLWSGGAFYVPTWRYCSTGKVVRARGIDSYTHASRMQHDVAEAVGRRMDVMSGQSKDAIVAPSYANLSAGLSSTSYYGTIGAMRAQQNQSRLLQDGSITEYAKAAYNIAGLTL